MMEGMRGRFARQAPLRCHRWITPTLTLLLLMLAGPMVGCSLVSGPKWGQVDDPFPTSVAALSETPPHHSVVFPSKRFRALDQAAVAELGDPWYRSRNDQQPTVISGYRGPTIERTHTRTFDRQRSFGGRVFDSYQGGTYRYESRSVVR